MQQEIVINALLPNEIRVAMLENGQLTELYHEQNDKKHATGNIYKGKVTRVLPGMQAAFVDIGLGKDAFLYVLDFYDNIEKYELEDEEPFPEPVAEAISICGTGAGEEEVSIDIPVDGPTILEGDEPLLINEPIPTGQTNNANNENNGNGNGNGRNGNNNPSKEGKHKQKDRNLAIETKLKVGQEIIVQIAKEPIGTKGARVTSHISLPGRYLVYMPTVEHIGVSRRIAGAGERSRLREIIKRIKPANCGFIVRTVGEGKDEDNFKADVDFLTKLWSKIMESSEKTSAPAILHQDLNVIFRSFRDIFTNEVDRVMIDSEEHFTQCVEFVNTLMPNLTDRIKLYLKQKPIFDYYNIETQLEKALKRKAWLKSGGYIIIDEAEALVAIDVNTGKYVGKKNLEETIFKINLEAIEEIVRQVRLRDLGGIIIIDFIDMKEEKHRQQLMQTLEEALKKDRTRTNVLQLTELGLVEMTRKRARKSLGKILTQPCPCCKGTGRVKTSLHVFNNIQRELYRLQDDVLKEEIILRVNNDVACLINENGNKRLRQLEKICNKKVILKIDDNLPYGEYDLFIA